MKKTILILALIPVLFISACSGSGEYSKSKTEITAIDVSDDFGIATHNYSHTNKEYIDAIISGFNKMKVSLLPISYNRAHKRSKGISSCGDNVMYITLWSDKGVVVEFTYIYGSPGYIGNSSYGYYRVWCSGDLRTLLTTNDGINNGINDDANDDVNTISRDYNNDYIGKFTDRMVTDGGTAILAVQDAAEMLGYGSVLDKLSFYRTSQDDGFVYYWLQAYHHGIPIYKSYVIVAASKEGEAAGIYADVETISEDISLTPKITYEEAVDAIHELAASGKISEFYDSTDPILNQNGEEKLSDDSLIIYCNGDEAHLAYLLTIYGYKIIVDAETCDVLNYQQTMLD